MSVRTPHAAARRAPRPGLTLLEVLVSMAIFIMSLVALSRLIEIGSLATVESSYQAQCLRLAQSKLNEAMADPQVLGAPGTGQFDEAPDYTWTLTVDDSPDNLDGVKNVQVMVSRPRADGTQSSVTLAQIVYDQSKRGGPPASSSSSSGASP